MRKFRNHAEAKAARRAFQRMYGAENAVQRLFVVAALLYAEQGFFDMVKPFEAFRKEGRMKP